LFPESGYTIEVVPAGYRLILAEPVSYNLLKDVGASAAAITELWAFWRRDPGDLSLLHKFARLVRLHLINRTAHDLSDVGDLRQLQTLTIDSDCAVNLDLASWPSLQELAADWRGEFTNLAAASQLCSLRISYWKDFDCERLRDAPNLRSLEIQRGKLESLRGLESCKQLSQLVLINLPKLVDFTAISKCRELQSVRIDTCRGLANLEPFHGLPHLKSFLVDNVGSIESLKPLQELTALRTLYFRESTNVRDGDTGVIRRLGIEDYAFQNRKHYNFTYDHLSKATGT
jgi:hypothetical protein